MAYLTNMAQAVTGSFLAPVYFAFLGLIPVVVLLYLLKLRRTPVVISSTLLWHKSLQDLTANAPFQRLRRNLLLLLQILILLLVILAMTRPFMKAEGTAGNDLCLIIDRSASMQTMETGTGSKQSRLEIAKATALRMVDDMASGDKIMLVTFAGSSDVLCELTDDRYTLRNAIRAIAPTDTASKIRDAVLVATSLQISAPLLRTVILSDGKIADLDEIGTRTFDVSFARVGETAENAAARNAGIVAFSVREPMEGDAARERQCLILVANDAPEPLQTTLTLDFNDAPMAVEEVNVPAKSTQEVVFALPDVDVGVLRAHLDVDDALSVDNTAWLVVRPPSTVRVLLVSEAQSAGAYFIKRVLGLNPRVELSTVTPSDFGATQGDFDITLFDSFAPPTLPPGLVVFFNALPPVPDLRADGTLDNPPIIATDPDHPVMRFLNPANVTVTKALKMVLPQGARALISTQGGALLADVSRGGQPILVVGFDLADSNWPLRLSFPLFIQNLIAWAPKATLAAETSVAAGTPLTILPVPNAETATVTMPNGTQETVKLDPTRPVYFGNTINAGVYRVRSGDKEETYAVNLLDPKESAITPAESLSIGRSEVAAQPERLLQNRELWHWFVLAALGVLTLEWWIYCRRAWL